MRKIIFLILLILLVSCQKGGISDRSIFASNAIKEKDFEVKEKVRRVRVVISGDIKEGQLNIVLVDSKNNLLIQEVVQENFRFSRTFPNPAAGSWYVRGKFLNGVGNYKIKIYLE